MKHRILIIDDEKLQAINLQKAISTERNDIFVDVAFDEETIATKIRDTYFNIAIVDLRMDEFATNGFTIIKDILDINPFAKIIVISAYTKEYEHKINEILKTGKISSILDKEKFDNFKVNVISEIDKIISQHESDPLLTKSNLEFLYSEVKNESDTYTKGYRFEYFVTSLFSQMGFNHINKRLIDKSRNEVDLIIRNEIKDPFFQKFKPYFLVECKNTLDSVDKNQFIQFRSKIENTNSLSNLGFIVTPKGFKRTTYIEAVRSSKEEFKIVFLSNSEILELINADNILETLKRIIDSQVKDN